MSIIFLTPTTIKNAFFIYEDWIFTGISDTHEEAQTCVLKFKPFLSPKADPS